MQISKILTDIDNAKGKQKAVILQSQLNNQLLKRVLQYTYDSYKQYYLRPSNIPDDIKIRFPKGDDDYQWSVFLNTLDRLNAREITGGAAIEAIRDSFCYITEENEFWMRRVLDRHLNIGITSKTVNKIYEELIPVFLVQLAHPYNSKDGSVSSAGKFIDSKSLIAIEPKLDGFRCVAIVRDGACILYSRNGKVISDNFEDTIVKQLSELNRSKKIGDLVLDGELMGPDFRSTAQMVHRKIKLAEVDNFWYNVFDWMPLKEWLNQTPSMNAQITREQLEDMNLELQCKHVRLVERIIVPPSERKKYHDIFVAQKYEGIMLKSLDTTYEFKRGKNVVKYKEFFDEDLEVVGFEEGKVGSENEGVLGAIIVKNGTVRVNVGSGFSREQRQDIWSNQSKYRFSIAEIRYQGITEDGSLRFPTFRRWRADKE